MNWMFINKNNEAVDMLCKIEECTFVFYYFSCTMLPYISCCCIVSILHEGYLIGVDLEHRKSFQLECSTSNSNYTFIPTSILLGHTWQLYILIWTYLHLKLHLKQQQHQWCFVYRLFRRRKRWVNIRKSLGIQESAFALLGLQSETTGKRRIFCKRNYGSWP